MPVPKPRLLIVDDDPHITATLSSIFSGLGHQVHIAEDGFSALKSVRAEVPDILLSDLNMPNMSGFELLSVVRRRFPGVFVIAVSAAFTGDAVPRGLAADAFHAKGTGLTQLFELVKAATYPHHARSDAGAAVTVWVTHAGERSAGTPLSITCPECLRGFAISWHPMDFLVETTVCPQCDAAVRYGLVPAMDPVHPAVPRAKPVVSAAVHLPAASLAEAGGP